MPARSLCLLPASLLPTSQTLHRAHSLIQNKKKGTCKQGPFSQINIPHRNLGFNSYFQVLTCLRCELVQVFLWPYKSNFQQPTQSQSVSTLNGFNCVVKLKPHGFATWIVFPTKTVFSALISTPLESSKVSQMRKYIIRDSIPPPPKKEPKWAINLSFTCVFFKCFSPGCYVLV